MKKNRSRERESPSRLPTSPHHHLTLPPPPHHHHGHQVVEHGVGVGGSGWKMVPLVVVAVGGGCCCCCWFHFLLVPGTTLHIASDGSSSLAGVTIFLQRASVAHSPLSTNELSGVSCNLLRGGSVGVPTACRALCVLLCLSLSTESVCAELARLCCGAG